MINSKLLSSTNQLHYIATESNKLIVPLDNTPVSRLVERLGPFDTDLLSDDELIAKANGQSTSLGPYASELESMGKKAAGTLSKVVSIARGTINPICRDILEQIETDSLAVAARESGLDYTIRQVEVHTLFTDETFTALLEDYIQAEIQNRDSRKVLEAISDELSEEEIRGLCATGAVTLDGRVKDYLSKHPLNYYLDSNLNNVYADQPLNEAISTLLVLNSLLNGGSYKADALLDTDAARADILSIRNKVGHHVYKLVNRLLVSVGRNDLFADSLLVGGTDIQEIPVYGKTYRKWLTEGGSPEALIGYASTEGLKAFGVAYKTLIANPTVYADKYSIRKRQLDLKLKVLNIQIVHKAIQQELTTEINRLHADLDTRASLQTKVTKALQVTLHVDSNVTDYVRKAVCSVLCEGNTVYELLTTIDNVIASDSEIDMDTAIYMGVIITTSNWVASQLQCS